MAAATDDAVMPETRRPNLLFLAVKPFRDCLAFAGGSTRSEMLAFLFVGMLANAFRVEGLHDPFGPPSAVEIGWAVIWNFPAIALTVRRLHDQGRSAWWMLIHVAAIATWAIAMLLPQGSGGPQFTLLLWSAHPASPLASILLGIISSALILAMIILDFLPGRPDRNRYGPDPRIGAESAGHSPATEAA